MKKNYKFILCFAILFFTIIGFKPNCVLAYSDNLSDKTKDILNEIDHTGWEDGNFSLLDAQSFVYATDMNSVYELIFNHRLLDRDSPEAYEEALEILITYQMSEGIDNTLDAIDSISNIIEISDELFSWLVKLEPLKGLSDAQKHTHAVANNFGDILYLDESALKAVKLLRGNESMFISLDYIEKYAFNRYIEKAVGRVKNKLKLNQQKQDVILSATVASDSEFFALIADGILDRLNVDTANWYKIVVKTMMDLFFDASNKISSAANAYYICLIQSAIHNCINHLSLEDVRDEEEYISVYRSLVCAYLHCAMVGWHMINVVAGENTEFDELVQEKVLEKICLVSSVGMQDLDRIFSDMPQTTEFTMEEAAEGFTKYWQERYPSDDYHVSYYYEGESVPGETYVVYARYQTAAVGKVVIDLQTGRAEETVPINFPDLPVETKVIFYLTKTDGYTSYVLNTDSIDSSVDVESDDQAPQMIHELLPHSISASSTLIEEGFDNSAYRAFDGNVQTAWQEGSEGNGYGESLSIEFFDKNAYITSGVIYTGFLKNEDTFYGNGAPSSVTIITGDGEEATFHFADYSCSIEAASNGYSFYFEKPVKTSGIWDIIINDVRPGQIYEDTCISEIKFYGSDTGYGSESYDLRNTVPQGYSFTYVDDYGRKTTYRLYTMPLSWSEANAYCRSMNGKLVTIYSADELSYICSELERIGMKDKRVYVGARLKSDPFGYIWLSEQDIVYFSRLFKDADAYWMSGEPSYYDSTLGVDETVVELRYSDKENRWVFNDIPDNLPDYLSDTSSIAFLCEMMPGHINRD